MKVIKHGNFYKEDRKIQCICGCEFEYDMKDIYIDNYYELTSCPPQYKRYVLCPECNARTDIGTTYAMSWPNKATPYEPYFKEEV